jgi:hypothetical protein
VPTIAEKVKNEKETHFREYIFNSATCSTDEEAEKELIRIIELSIVQESLVTNWKKVKEDFLGF